MFLNLNNEEIFMLIIFAMLIFAMGVLVGVGAVETKKELKNKPKKYKICPKCKRKHQRYDRYCLSCEDIRIGLS